MNIADKLIDFKNTRNIEVLGDIPNISSKELIVIVTRILSWLKLERKREIWTEQGRKMRHRPMELNLDYPWCNDLISLLKEDNPLAEVFCVTGRYFSFKDRVSPEYIKEARRIAYEKYNPQMIIN